MKNKKTIEELKNIKNEFIDQYFSFPDIIGIGIGDQCLQVYVMDDSVQEKIPETFQGVNVQCVVTGEIVAL